MAKNQTKDVRFYIKRPTQNDKAKKAQRTFSVYSRVVNPDSSTTNTFIKLKTLDAINAQFLKGYITYEVANKNVEKLIEGLYQERGIFKPAPTFNTDNDKILENYWKEEYEHRDLQDPDSAQGKLRRAVAALGNVSLLSGTQLAIQTAVNKLQGNRQREVVEKLNSLLTFIGRRPEIRLKKARPVRYKVRYLSVAELQQVLAFVEEPEVCTLAQVIFSTGARPGECFAMSEDAVKATLTTVLIETQMDEDEIERPPKWGSVRPAYIIPGGADHIFEWTRVMREVELKSRDAMRHSFKKACMKAFPGRTEKYCSFKELRHSYAIHLLNNGVSLSLIAQSLGNSLDVCQRYYAGFELTAEGVDAIDLIMKRKR